MLNFLFLISRKVKKFRINIQICHVAKSEIALGGGPNRAKIQLTLKVHVLLNMNIALIVHFVSKVRALYTQSAIHRTS